MRTGTVSKVGRLLVDLETGRVLRADDTVEITQRLIDTHPFMTSGYSVTMLRHEVFAGPDCAAAVQAIQHGQSVDPFAVVRYEVVANVAGLLTVQKVEA
jgi:hypothetical protein